MNRVIKFRAWLSDSKNNSNQQMIFSDNVGLSCFFDNISSWLGDVNKISQFSGLTDKNGTDIYEGDICIVNKKSQKWQIKWFQPYCGFCLENKEEAYPLNESNDIEIIGNIFENPELIK
jgi:hypothetical protein